MEIMIVALFRKVIFVFGSNLAGRHGKGAAHIAKMYYGAIQGQGEGLQGNSYGIATKDEHLRPRNLYAIKKSVETFVRFAEDNPQMQFKVCPIGTGLAGFTHEDIAPMFALVPSNCVLPSKWKNILSSSEHINYWDY